MQRAYWAKSSHVVTVVTVNSVINVTRVTLTDTIRGTMDNTRTHRGMTGPGVLLRGRRRVVAILAVMGMFGAGMTIVRLDEHVASASDPRGDCMTREPDGLFRLRAGRGGAGALPEPLPVLFTLVAERPGPRGTLSEDEPVG